MSLSESKIFKELLPNYFSQYNVTNIQKDGFEELIHKRFQEIIDEEPTIEIQVTKREKYIVTFGDVTIDNPHIIEEDRTVRKITPAESRIRDLTYDSPLCINIDEKHLKLIDSNWVITEHLLHNKIPITRIPIMLQTSKCNLYSLTRDEITKKGECVSDNGGYFIIKGKERVLVSQERINYNIIYVFPQKAQSKFKYIAEIRSMSDETGHSILLQCKIDKNGKNISYSLPYITQDIPVGIVFKALGILKIEEIQNIISSTDPKMDKYINNIIYESFMIETQEDALDYIGKFTMHTIHKDKRNTYVQQILENELFPHMGITCSIKERVYFLGFIVNKLIMTFSGLRVPDDRDHLSNKRNESSGILIGDLFRSLYKRFIRSLQPQLQKRQDIIIAISRYNTITHGIKHCFSTGNWGVQKNAYIRMGVSQILSRLTYSATISHLRRLVIPIGKEGKNTKIRQIHNSQIGYVCPAETPEGHAAGIVKNFTLVCKISNHISTNIMNEIICKIDDIKMLKDVNSDEISKSFKILVNGYWIGITFEEDKLLENLRNKRDIGIINNEVSISINKVDREILIFSDRGRLLRPLIPVKDNKLIINDDMEMNWDKLVEENKIQYLDSYEVDNSVIAMNQKELNTYEYNYCEIHPSLMLGVCASNIPFPDHTQSPRNTYQSAMGKQALGIYATSNELRADTVVHTLQYAQEPIVYTHVSQNIGFNKMASGINCIVAIGCYSGFNQEDSIIMNKSAIQKGLFRSFVYRTISISEKKRSANCFESIELPEPKIRLKSYNYQKLDKNGLVRIGEVLKKNDIIIGRVITKTSKSGNDVKTDASVTVKHGEEGIVDKVFITISPDGYKIIKIKIRSQRIPEIGDKFASREAQKGTCGMIFNQEDMPFTNDGVVPDIIINPHCIPSRMTINQLLECIGAKSSVIDMKFRDCTAFSESSTNIISTLENALERNGYEGNGYETMYSGLTGEQLQAKIFIGPVYYQRLKHLVHDKIHARDHGNVQSLTRQPLEGRSRDGGLRFGEMERDCMISHGPSKFLMERLFNMSDPYQVDVCDNCGQIPSKTDECNFCKCDTIKQSNIPYACKLLFQELIAIGIKISLKPS